MKRFARSVVVVTTVGMVVGCGGGSRQDEPAASRAESRAELSAPTTAATESPASPGHSPTASPPKAATAGTSATRAAGEKDDPATTRRVLGIPAGWELAPRANYTARQAAGVVAIKATGKNPTGGYKVKLFESPLRIWPPQWMLAHKKPEGPVTQAFTPFEATASFKADQPVKQVVVSDAAGKHEVKVEQAQD